MAVERREWNRRVDDLLQAGKRAFSEDKPKLAHDLWREAATVDPYDERVWMALLRVLDAPEDKRVCLENILAINPLNAKARRQLRAYHGEVDREVVLKERQRAQAVARRKESRRAFRRSLITGIWIGLVGVLLGIIASVVVYGYHLIPLPVLF